MKLGSKTVSDTEKYLFTDAERDAYAWGVKDAEDALNDDEYDRVVSESIYLGELRARNRIVSQLKEYVEDLRICSKNDSCADIAYAIQGQVEEITGEEMQDSYSAERVTEIEDKAYEVGKATGLRESSEEFIDGMAEVHEVVYITLDRLQQSLNDTMGIYMDMPEDITRKNPEVKELSAMYAVLTQFREMFIDNYDEAMRNYHSSKNYKL